jgi:hypothetical protein
MQLEIAGAWADSCRRQASIADAGGYAAPVASKDWHHHQSGGLVTRNFPLCLTRMAVWPEIYPSAAPAGMSLGQ